MSWARAPTFPHQAPGAPRPPPPPPNFQPYQPPQPRQTPQRNPPQPTKRALKPNPNMSRDLALAHNTARRLGQAIPGNNAQEIEAWIAARKRNWPSRANVQRKLAQAARASKGALEKLTEYASTDDDAGRAKEKKPRRRRARGRRRGRGIEKRDVPLCKRRPTLLKMLLKDEIQQETDVLLQAFRYLLRKRRAEDDSLLR